MLELTVASIAILIGITAVIYSRVSSKKSRDCRELVEFLGKRIEDLEESVKATKTLSENEIQHIAEQGRRIAWLESRVRQTKPVEEEEVLNEEHLDTSTKSLITERRHRVLKLAHRGQSIEEIAGTLGMMHGEVQLIINLSRMSA